MHRPDRRGSPGRQGVRLSAAEHAAHPWVIADIAPDFRLLDAWALPLAGDREDFADALEVLTAFEPEAVRSLPARALFWVRFRLGDLLGWDEDAEPRPIPGCVETSLRDRLPRSLRDRQPMPAAGGFSALYQTDDEWAAELSNQTVHGVLHLGWVEQKPGHYRAQLGVYVKSRGRLGAAYLASIGPFRHLVVYPALLHELGERWSARQQAAGRDVRPAEG